MSSKRPLGLLILGRQGSGKGTQSARIAELTGVVHISTGDILRQAVADQTDLGKQAEAIMTSGGLVGDDTMIPMVAERLAQDDIVANGFLLDGFPRTLPQADALVTMDGVTVDLVINLDVPIDECTSRMLARGRQDDTEEAIRLRLELYAAETEAPLKQWATNRGVWTVVNGLGSEDEVGERLTAALATLAE